MKYCSKCSKRFDDRHLVCDVDGDRLVDGEAAKRYELMGKIFGGAMSQMLGGKNNIDVFFDFDKTSWDALAGKNSNNPRIDRFRLVAPAIFYCANQAALHFHEECQQEGAPNHLEELMEFICLYAVLLKKTTIANEGFVMRSWSAWPKFLEALKNEMIANLAIDETQSKEFWATFTALLSQREKLYKESPLKHRFSVDYSSSDIFSTFARAMRERCRPGPRIKSVESAAITAAVIGLNIVPTIMNVFLETSPSSEQ